MTRIRWMIYGALAAACLALAGGLAFLLFRRLQRRDRLGAHQGGLLGTGAAACTLRCAITQRQWRLPATFDETSLRKGAHCFHVNCVQCHGAPGQAPAAFAGGLLPAAKSLVHTARDLPVRAGVLDHAQRHPADRHAGMGVSVSTITSCGQLRPSSIASCRNSPRSSIESGSPTPATSNVRRPGARIAPGCRTRAADDASVRMSGLPHHSRHHGSADTCWPVAAGIREAATDRRARCRTRPTTWCAGYGSHSQCGRGRSCLTSVSPNSTRWTCTPTWPRSNEFQHARHIGGAVPASGLAAGLLTGCLPVDPATDTDAQSGQLLLEQYDCGNCHIIPGVRRAHGPDGSDAAELCARARTSPANCRISRKCWCAGSGIPPRWCRIR